MIIGRRGGLGPPQKISPSLSPTRGKYKLVERYQCLLLLELHSLRRDSSWKSASAATSLAKYGRVASPPDPLRPHDPTPQHCVTLSSVEDDALGEELQVIWEIEPGNLLVEGSALPQPTGFDDPRRFDAFMDAVRWGAIASADVRALQAPFRSGIAIEDYQLDPVVRAIQMPRANLLIADDVGLGKTIEADLVIQELILRHRARSVLIVCPSALQIQ